MLRYFFMGGWQFFTLLDLEKFKYLLLGLILKLRLHINEPYHTKASLNYGNLKNEQYREM